MNGLLSSPPLLNQGQVARRRHGFTLIELMVALSIGGVAVLLAHAVFAQTLDGLARGREVATASVRHTNRHAWLVRAFGSLTTSSRPQRGFSGTTGVRDGLEADEIRFHAFLRTPGGPAVRQISLALDDLHRLAATLIAPDSATPPATVLLSEPLVQFGAEYLLEYGAGARWVRSWQSPVTAPLAARLRLYRTDGVADTLLFHIGARG